MAFDFKKEYKEFYMPKKKLKKNKRRTNDGKDNREQKFPL